jgi:Flp pilus assembly protein TadD
MAMTRVLVVLTLALLSGCSTVQPVAGDQFFADAAFADHRVRHDPADLFKLTSEMRGYAANEVAPSVRTRGPQRGLVDALYSTAHLQLTYEALTTRTAAEAFEARSGNCLSLVIMTSAFAKEMGLEVRYQQVHTEDMWVRDDDLVQLVGHVNLSLGRGQSMVHRASSPVEWLTVDFIPLDDAQHLRSRVIGETRVIAMYYNNKAAEALSAGRTGEAYWWAKAAVETDRAYPGALVTLGVVMHRQGLLDKAELASRAALRLDPENPPALHNLALILQVSGRIDEAAATSRLLKNVQPDNPIETYKSGLIAFQRGDYPRARDAFRNALRRAPEDQEFHFMLGMSYLKLGETASALEHLQRAQALAPNSARKRAYAAKIARIEEEAKRGLSPAAMQ